MDYQEYMDEVIRKRKEDDHYRQYIPPLTDYQIAQAFQGTLSLIYKDKMAELHSEMQDIYDFLDSLKIPQFSDKDKKFFNDLFNDKVLCPMGHRNFKAIAHINRIRRVKLTEEDIKEELDIEKARNVPIETIYDFRRKGKNVGCPFHTDKHPSASIKYNRLVCFQCGFKGDTIAFFLKINNLDPRRDFRKAVQTLTGEE